ncbi:MAG: LemA family protein [Candidatus Melainabacteria bacterium GWF2_37_15]|nr:MAG: LemA family protein [Candidatus Melainabacteria bacterium GWF2_37_15]
MKKTGLYILGGIILVIVLLFGSFIGSYNKLQVMDETVTSSWAQVENQLQRRNDLIPNLVNTVKGYAGHEKEIFTNIAESRSKLAGAVKAGNIGDVNKANAEFSGALSRLLAIAENYPDLKANQNFIALQDELAGTENRIAVARKDYNETVKSLNAKIRTFPTVIIANLAGIKAREYFEVEEAAKEAPDVKF